MADNSRGALVAQGLQRMLEKPQEIRRTKKQRMASNWSRAETLQLLRLMGDSETQAALGSLVHNRFIWEGISAKMKTRKTADQCNDRWSYLKRRFRETMEKQKTDHSFTCNYFYEMKRILAKRPTATVKQAASSSAQPTHFKPEDALPASSNAQGSTPGGGAPRAQQGVPVPSLPELPDSDQDEDDDDDDDDGDLEETEGDDIQDFFGHNQAQDVEIDFSAEMTENNDNKTGDPLYTTFSPAQATTDSTRSKKRPSSSQQNNSNKRPRGRPRLNPPPRDDMTVAQAITDAVMRFIDHQSYHLTEQNKLLQRYLKFERARMRWEMDMEARRMKWEEEREIREEERRQRQEELEAKRVSENREFMLQMAVVLGGGEGSGATADSKDAISTKE